MREEISKKKIINKISKIEKWATQLTIYAQQAVLYEAVLSPKPGLVDPVDSGAHRDMNIYTFMDSTCSLYQGFYQFAQKGLLWKDSLKKLFEKIRFIGIELEKKMLKETKNINTHKGIIFSMGIFLAATGFFLQRYLDVFIEFPIFEKEDSDEIFKIIKKMTRGLVAEDFKQIDKKDTLTHGEKLYFKYGFTGIRGEAEAGYPFIENQIMPRIRCQDKKESLQCRLLEILFLLMSNTEDSNVIHRGGVEALELVKKEAKNFLKTGGLAQENALKKIEKMNSLFVQKHISPGGSADLLIVSIFLGKLENIL
ncbi:triphosphoribosyl-dephospho-CoA synthase CitG [Garciella nitratireducens]|uniref:Probable 2-(5''-triphosphoribosyl)-3'-dephosphocoenzyme-A synthase n=1 Tax=Garciella nitratireducens DSM 15102 TaxID=1121911 RepID=A0A1T4LGM3_9FIRM|nr:triphosphoribosyl-dephospho-CoA synthase CitG [Garciella nitratireducens]RBP46794.1 triphosphoribosyl-dephospho-CoA synthase [Garciella nitratireducens]SJZ53721.1 triphosphoribosyl-dephospho-CoA synthase [Garciella nitratireducens DSM 15102]